MSDVLVLKISPPMQSWGIGDLYDSHRKTNRYPTKSGVVGMIAAALGWDRNHDLNDLNRLRMGVRIDSPGNLENDFQMIKKPGESNGKPSNRWFLSDAVFIIALQGDDKSLLKTIQSALMDPVFNIFAGRKAFPLNFDMVQGIHENTTVANVLESLDWMGRGGKPDKIEIIRDANDLDLDVDVISDTPVNFELDHREWALRPVTHYWLDLADPIAGSISTNVCSVNWEDEEDEDYQLTDDLGDLDFMTGEDVD